MTQLLGIEFAGPDRNSKDDRNKEVEKAFLLALGRPPSASEREKAIQLFAAAPARDAITRLGLVLFNLNEFLYLE